MRFSTIAGLVLSCAYAIKASPTVSGDLIKRGNGVEIIYLVTCNGEPHASRAAYYANWQDSQTYGAHQPNSVSATNAGFTSASANWVWYYFSDTNFRILIDNYDPGWYNVAGSAHSAFGVDFVCRMDNGRQIYDACFSNYYCQ